jgi:hypothetical protein
MALVFPWKSTWNKEAARMEAQYPYICFYEESVRRELMPLLKKHAKEFLLKHLTELSGSSPSPQPAASSQD